MKKALLNPEIPMVIGREESLSLVGTKISISSHNHCPNIHWDTTQRGKDRKAF